MFSFYDDLHLVARLSDGGAGLVLVLLTDRNDDDLDATGRQQTLYTVPEQRMATQEYESLRHPSRQPHALTRRGHQCHDPRGRGTGR